MKSWIIAGLTALALVSVAEAKGKGKGKGHKDGEHHGACADDVKKFCKDVEPGKGRIAKCLKEHEAELSEACKNKGQAMKEKMKEAREKMQAACKADLEKHCKDVEPGEGRIGKCLKEHKDDLSDTCKAEMKEKREAMKAKRKAHRKSKGADNE